MPEFKWAPKLTGKIVSIWVFPGCMQNRQELILHIHIYYYIHKNWQRFLLLAFGGNSVLEYGLCSCIGNSGCVWGVKFSPLPVNEPLFSTAWVLQAGNFVCLKWRERNGVPDRKIARICFESPNGSQNRTCLGKHWALHLVLECAHKARWHLFLLYLYHFRSTGALCVLHPQSAW